MDEEKCPNCGSHEFEGDEITIDRGKAYQTCTCYDCGCKWDDVYTLTAQVIWEDTK